METHATATAATQLTSKMKIVRNRTLEQSLSFARLITFLVQFSLLSSLQALFSIVQEGFVPTVDIMHQSKCES